jgi:hypothetical protein
LVVFAIASEVAAFFVVVRTLGLNRHIPAIVCFVIGRVTDGLSIDWPHALLADDGLRHFFESDELPDDRPNSIAVLAGLARSKHH